MISMELLYGDLEFNYPQEPVDNTKASWNRG